MDEPIRSHLPNENYRRGWDETFGKPTKHEEAEYHERYVLTRLSKLQRERFLFEEWDCVLNG